MDFRSCSSSHFDSHVHNELGNFTLPDVPLCLFQAERHTHVSTRPTAAFSKTLRALSHTFCEEHLSVVVGYIEDSRRCPKSAESRSQRTDIFNLRTFLVTDLLV